MNPALLQHSYPLDYSLNNESKYLGSDRNYSSSNTINSQDSSQLGRRHHNGLNNTQLGHTLGLTTNTGLEYTAHPLISDNSYQSTTQLLLSPPAPIESASTTGLQPTSSSFNFSGGLKLSTSNVSSTEHFAPSTTPFLSSAWPESAMTDYNNSRRYRGNGVPPTLSPPMGYSPSNGISSQYLHVSHRPPDQYSTSHPFSRPFPGTEQPSSIFREARSPTFNQQSLAHPYSLGNPYGPMSLPPPSRPEGPSFDATKNIHTLVTARNQTLVPEISAAIQKGFFQVDGKWTCYRRNYFAVSCAFSFKSGNPDETVYLQRHSQLQPVQAYAVSISAQTGNGSHQDSEKRELVQHTPKRDKATESVPGRHVVQPAPLQSHSTGNGISVASIYTHGHGLISGFEGYSSQSHHTPTSYTFERIQFQKATANNGKRRAQQQFFHVVVELSVKVNHPGGDETWIMVASKKSDQMVVRGRSPGHYKDSIRRDSQANNDPDRSSGGAGADNNSVSSHMPSLLGPHASGMEWPPSNRHNSYGQSYSRKWHSSDGSPGSISSSTTMTGSPAQDDYHLPDFTTLRHATAYDLDRSILNPVSDHGSNPRMGLLSSSLGCKRSFEEENSEGESNFYSGTTSADSNFSPQAFEYNTTSGLKSLCAST